MITAIVITKNEEKNIEKCLKSIEWCDEIIVIDDDSTDKTTAIAKSLGVNVYTHPLNNNFADQRNFGLKKAKGDWVLFIDADERVPEALWFEIMQHTNSSISNANGFFIKRRDIMWGRELRFGETGSTKLLRLGRKNAGEWEGKVHEKWKIQRKQLTLNKELIHYPHENVKSFLSEINFYTDLRAKDLFDNKINTTWLSIIIFPTAKFMKNYFLNQGFRDGVPGVVNALMMSFHSFLVRSKLWLLNQKNKDD